jgi:type II secretory pathway component PulF
MNYLQGKANICDVIAWTMAAPAIAVGCICCPSLIQAFPKFKNMFLSLNAKLPPITVFLMDNNWWFCSFLPIGISIGIIIALMKNHNKSISVVVSALGFVLNWGIFSTAVSAIFLPIIELQKQLT